MNEFELTAMDNTGKPHYTLNGSHLQRLNNSDETEIKQPVIQFIQQNGQWKVSADTAIINNKDETIQLNKNVIMQQQNIEPAVTFRTHSLLLDTRTQIAQTDAPVEIIQGISNIKSNGMIFNNKTHELVLPSDVNGYYQTYELTE
jgi:lipopolysaccharide export system protein LptC